MSLETTERRSCNILPKEKVASFPGRYFIWCKYTSIHNSCKSTTPFARLKLWHLPILVVEAPNRCESTKSEAPLVGRNPSYRLPFHIAFTGPPKKMVKKNTHSFQTKKTQTLGLKEDLHRIYRWFFGLYYLSTRNFAENFHPTSHVGGPKSFNKNTQKKPSTQESHLHWICHQGLS